MKHLIIYTFFLLLTSSFTIAQDLGQAYIDQWKKFYPSKALAQGMHPSIYSYEDRSAKSIQEWMDFNEEMRTHLKDNKYDYRRNFPINSRMLNIQIRSELDEWEKLKIHQSSISLYSNLISRGFSGINSADFLSKSEAQQIRCQRLSSIIDLSKAAIENLSQVKKNELVRAKSQIEKVQLEVASLSSCDAKTKDAAQKALSKLLAYIDQHWPAKAVDDQPLLGKKEYARKLGLYTDSDLGPDELGKMALKEIEITRSLMIETSKEYLKEIYPQKDLPDTELAIVKAALKDMEADAPKDGKEYLAFWEDLAASAIQFIEDNKIATLPEFQTLRIQSAPESAGPAARIGWVSSAPPFAPNPVTTLYLPSIPDDFPEEERNEFWSSFNKPFNRMIVIHELYPGHYMQIKISRESPHPIRILFPYGTYIEGWATFAEKVLLDEGWEKENKLTLLAHLRKRLENANRAYTSVQVHCNDWDQDQVLKWSIEEAWLAPQFAKSLWGRIMRSPMQLTTYFLGAKQFKELMAKEKERLGSQFVLQDFMDTILKAGPIPIDDFEQIFKADIPNK